MSETVRQTGSLWNWTGDKANWVFVTIDGAAGEELSATAAMRRAEGTSRGWGSVRVTARIGDSEWQTSVFPDKQRGWLLPVKAAVRKAKGIAAGDEVEVELTF